MSITRALDYQALERSLNNRDGEHPLCPSTALLLASGGDQRIWADVATGRNRYGVRTTPAPEEISFSSTTASNISIAGFEEADYALCQLFRKDSLAPLNLDQWFETVRAEIRSLLGYAGAEIILAASGTDVELVTLCLAASLSQRPLTNIFIAPDETGNGVPSAAAGCHFSDLTALGNAVQRGVSLEGLPLHRIEVKTIAIRNERGEGRNPRDIDEDIIAVVETEIAKGRDALVHVLDTSKTGLSGVTRGAARYLAALAPGRVRIVVDACQLRSPISQIRQDLADGFLVAVTGSKFAGGPPFAGALLVPKAFVDELTVGAQMPSGLSEYCAAQDWSEPLRRRTAFTFTAEMNLGLSLRWIAALANLRPYAGVCESQQSTIKKHFARLVREQAKDLPSTMLHPGDNGEDIASRAIVPLTILDVRGSFAPLPRAHQIQAAMRDSHGGPVCHVGQAVRVGPRAVLRIGASACDVVGISERMAKGQSLEEAFEPLENDLDRFFGKWSTVNRHLQTL